MKVNGSKRKTVFYGENITEAEKDTAHLSQMKSVPIGKGVKKSLGKAFEILCESIKNKESMNNIYLSVNFPRILSARKSLGDLKESIEDILLYFTQLE